MNAPLRQMQASMVRLEIENYAEIIQAAASRIATHKDTPYESLRQWRVMEQAAYDMQACLELLNEELDCAPSDREIGEIAAHSINVERAGEINRG